MPWKESEAVPEGNGPVPQQEEFGSGQPTLEEISRMIDGFVDRFEKRVDSHFEQLLSEDMKMDQHLAGQEQNARQSRHAMEADGQASQLSEEMKMDQHLARQEQDARQSCLAMEAGGQASQLSEEMKMDQHLARLAQDARQSRLAMEADGQASTKTRERTEGAATAAMRGDCSSARRVKPGPINSTSFGMKAEPPAFPCRDVSVVECGAAAFKSCLPSMEMRTSTAAGGLAPTGDASKASETTLNEPPLRFCLTEETDLKAENSWTSIPSASYDSSSVFQERNLSATPYCRRVVDTKSGQNRTFDPGGSRGHLRACPLLGSWRALVCGKVSRAEAAEAELQRFFGDSLALWNKAGFDAAPV